MKAKNGSACHLRRLSFLCVTFFLAFSATLWFTAPADAAAYTQSGGTVTKTGQTYTASSTDQSGVYVYNSGVFTLSDSSVTTTGDSSSGDNSSFLGQNAGVLASNGTIHLSNCTVNTGGFGANGVFAYGASGVVTMTGGTIYCSGQLAHGIMASGGGTLTAANVNMTTLGANSAAIATDRGGGTLTVNGGTMNTSGQDSPGIYSTGVITITDATITATGSEGAVIEGLNDVSLTNTSLTGGNSNYGGVLLMQSMSGDSTVGTAQFAMNGGSLTAPTGSLFFVTNTDAAITLTGVTTSVTSGTLLTAEATSRWGTTGSNGGDVTLTADGQALSGSVIVDSISTLSATLENGSTLTGAVNTANTAKSVALTMDASSTWTVTADSHVSTIADSAAISGTSVSNITGNGYHVYYNASLSANTYLGGLTYSLVNGGKLLPEGTTVDQIALTVAVQGRGSVVPAEGTHHYDEGSTVSLSATPELGWEFVEWQGDATGTDNPITITMSEDKTVTAVFEAAADLPVDGVFGHAILAGLLLLAYCLRGRITAIRSKS